MTRKIAVLGSLNVDSIMKMPRMPFEGETMALSGVTTAPGGKGANQAVAAARQGAEVGFIGAVGNEANGQFMKATLLSNDVNIDHVATLADTPTGSAYIMLQENGANTIMIHGGANQALTQANVDEAHELIAEADVLIAQFEVPFDIIVSTFKLAKEHGVQTILNPAPAVYKLTPELMAVTDLIVPNETEAQLLSGIDVVPEEDVLAQVADELAKQGAKRTIITLGGAGSYIANGDDRGIIPPVPVKAVDTTAAGDTFIGTLANVVDADFGNLRESIITASRASAIAVTRPGAIPSIPTKAELEAFGDGTN
jgi:ribokinase